MTELVVSARIMIEEAVDYVYMSRVGITCLNRFGELISFVLDPNEAPYTVVVQDCLVLPGLHLMVSHVFVDRYMKWAGLDEPFQVWRWHLDVYPPMGIVPVQYGVYGDSVLRKDRIYRSSFEPVGGPELTDPVLLGMQFAAKDIPTAACSCDLVAERQLYRRDSPFLPHPGNFDARLGILVDYESVLEQDKTPKQEWVM
jgi:hypothetical protein